MLALVAGLGVMVAQTELPEPRRFDQASYICAADVKPGDEQAKCTPENAMTRLQNDEGNRTNVTLDEVPDVVKHAVLAVEDRDFYEHDGVNPQGILRALFQNAKAGSVQQGGSTITQQYVLASFIGSREGGLSRKVKEAVLSIKLEQQMSKDEILEGYLNTIYFGRGAYGIAAASRAYFDKDVRELTDPGKAALLAGLIRAPNAAEPTTYPEEAERRRHTALEAMQDEGYITAAQAELSQAVAVDDNWVKPVSKVRQTATLRGASRDDTKYMGMEYVSDFVYSELRRLDPDRFTDEVIRGAGLRVYTSIDYDAQRAAWQAVTSTLFNADNPDTPEYEGDPEAAMVVVDDQGLVRAMVGSRHRYDAETSATNYAFRNEGSGGFQPGSTFKPFVLAQALIEGYSLDSRYNAPAEVEIPEFRNTDGTPWTPQNYSESDAGVMDLVEATRQSSNTAYAQLMADLGTDPVEVIGGDGQPLTNDDGDTLYAPEGPNKVAELVESMGIGAGGGIPAGQRVGPMVLGTFDTTPLEMAGAYATFMNRGVYRQPSVITRVEQVADDGGITVLYERKVDESRILTETQADLVTHTLQQVLESGGTGANANFGKPAAGKTGTANENKAAWFAGYTPGLSAAVWMGYPEADYPGNDDPATEQVEMDRWPMNTSGRLVQGRSATGGSFPAEIWRKFMEVAAADLTGTFPEVSEEALKAGTVLNDEDLRLPSETTTTLPPDTREDPGITLPTLPRPRPTAPTTAPDTTTTTQPETTLPTFDPTTTTTGQGPGGGNGGGP
jgi:penicillin-binding protein 1A